MPILTAKEMAPAIGASVYVRFEQVRVLATVKDVKTAYGAVRLLIVPAAGQGQQWVDFSRVGLEQNPTPPLA